MDNQNNLNSTEPTPTQYQSQPQPMAPQMPVEQPPVAPMSFTAPEAPKKSKKKLIIIIAIILALLLIGGGLYYFFVINKPATTSENNVSPNTPDSTPAPAAKSKISLPDEIKDPFRKIAFDTPSWQLTDEGYSEMLNRGDLLIVYERFLKDEGSAAEIAKTIKSTDEVFPLTFSFFKQHTNTKFIGRIKGFNITNNETVTIVGLPMTKFEGYIDCVTSHPDDAPDHRYLIGYAFIKDDTPAYIAGIVLDEDQTAELKTEIQDTVEAMINTLRDDRK